MTSEERLRRMEAWLSNLYKDAEEEMRGKWDDYMARQEKRSEKLLKAVDDAGTPEEKQAAEAKYKAHLKAVTSGSEYYRDMVKELARQYHDINVQAAKIVNGQRAEFFADGYNFSAGEINTAAISHDIGIRFDLCSAEAVEWLAERQNDLLLPGPREPKAREDMTWNIRNINSQVAQGIVQGESIPKIAARLRNVSDMNLHSSIRNARTMATGCQNGGRVQAMKTAEDWGVQTRKEWVCTHDSRTRDSHLNPPPKGVSGERVGPDEWFSNNCRFPGDPVGPASEVYNCRCTLVTVVDGFSSTLPKGKEGAIRVSFGDEPSGQGGGVATPGGWGRVRALRSAKPAADMSSAELKEIGRAFYESEEYRRAAGSFGHDRTAAADYYAAVKEWNEAVDRLNRMKVRTAEDLERWNAEREKLRPLEERLNKAKEAFEKANEGVAQAKGEVSRLIAEARGEGRGFASAEQRDKHLGRTTETRKAVADAYGRYPESWVRASTDKGALSVKKVSRGYYSDGKNELMISGDGGEARNTVVHEIGHRMERVKGLVEAERKYYNERTAGESLKWLGDGYARSEVTRKDQFVDSYMGKDYGGSAYELVSMGMEGIIGFTNRTDLSGDEDMRDWITGILLAY